MLYRGKQDMFNERPDVMINPVNCSGLLSSKTARAFKAKFPDMMREYQRKCSCGDVEAGRLHFWKGKCQTIVNFPIKNRFSDAVQEQTIEAGLVALREYLASAGKVKVTIPALGCEAEANGLKWETVKSLYRKHLGDLEAVILVYPPDESEASVEPPRAVASAIDFAVLCKAAEEIQEGWSPEIGDTVVHPKYGRGIVFTPTVDNIVVKFINSKANITCPRVSLTFVPTVEHLQKMLAGSIETSCGLDYCNAPLTHLRQHRERLDYYKSFPTAESFWFALVMDTIFSKNWSQHDAAWISW